jgi:DNA-binding transcriptional MerR regulator
MKNGRESPWTIDELAAAVGDALAEGYDGAPNGRVRDVPDRRTIRYYTTLGLIDRPAEMRGRTALYSRRHLLQLVAIKKLQAQGRSLAELQRTLAGQTDQALARLAGLDAEGPGSSERPEPTRRTERAFWRQVPEPGQPGAEDESRGDRDPPIGSQQGEDVNPQTLQGIPLVKGVTLLLASSRPLDGHDLEAIRKAAAALIRTLNRRQLIPAREEGEPL